MYTVTQIKIHLNQKQMIYIRILKLSKIQKEFPFISFNLHENSSMLLAKGTVKETDKFRKMIDVMKVPSEILCQLEQRKFTFLNSKLGHQKLMKLIHRKAYPLAFHFENSSLTFLCDKNDLQLANTAVEELKKILIIGEHIISKSFATLQSEHDDFSVLYQKLTSQNSVMINIVDNKLVIVGFQEDIKQCVHPLLECIKRICSTEESITIEVGIWKLIKTHMQDKWQLIASKCNQLQVDYKEPPAEVDTDSCKLSFKGDKLSVAEIIQDFSILKAKLVKCSLEKVSRVHVVIFDLKRLALF